MVKKNTAETKEDKRAAALRANLRRRKDKANNTKKDNCHCKEGRKT